MIDARLATHAQAATSISSGGEASGGSVGAAVAAGGVCSRKSQSCSNCAWPGGGLGPDASLFSLLMDDRDTASPPPPPPK
eukprot:2466917-Rhodomonas_salina.4